jgi:anti-sigma factor RsiW
MTFKFPASDPDRFSDSDNQKLNSSKEDCFELLSAYLDGEVTPQERQQVQQWLDSDPEIKKIYLQLQRMHSGIQGINIPSANTSSQQISQEVFATIDRRQQKQRVLIWGGGAIAAMCLVALSNIFSGSGSVNFKFANSLKQDKSVNQPLMVAVAVNKPAVKIPKAAKAVSSSPEKQTSSN